MTYRDLDPQAAQAELQRDPGLRILDVRTAPEYQERRLRGSLLLPVQELARRLRELDPAASWLVHCEHGHRSRTACEILAAAGFRNLANLRGGMAAWVKLGLPSER